MLVLLLVIFRVYAIILLSLSDTKNELKTLKLVLEFIFSHLSFMIIVKKCLVFILKVSIYFYDYFRIILLT